MLILAGLCTSVSAADNLCAPSSIICLLLHQTSALQTQTASSCMLVLMACGLTQAMQTQVSSMHCRAPTFTNALYSTSIETAPATVAALPGWPVRSLHEQRWKTLNPLLPADLSAQSLAVKPIVHSPAYMHAWQTCWSVLLRGRGRGRKKTVMQIGEGPAAMQSVI